MRVVRTPFGIVRENLRPYLWLNLMAYGLLVAGMVAGVLSPDLNAALTGSMDDGGTTDQVVSLLRTPWLFALAILFVNLSRIALATILLPSLIVPFLGIAAFAWFAVRTGITLRR